MALVATPLSALFIESAAAKSAIEQCLAASSNISLDAPLPRAAAKARKGTLRIIAIGSSSTSGLWGGGRGFPEVMATELTRLRPTLNVHVENSGRLGDTIHGNLARFERDVLAHKPDLVIWQLGTNDVVWGGRVSDVLEADIGRGIDDLRRAGIDIVLMDLQYAPAVLNATHGAQMQAAIHRAAAKHRVGLFSRYALFAQAEKAGLDKRELNSFDGLHHSRAGYDCIGIALARAVSRALR